MRNHRWARSVLALAGVSSLALAACGGDDEAESDATTPVPAATDGAGTQPPASGGFEVTIVDFAFDIPGEATAGTPFTIVNNDGFGHTFSDAGGAFSVSTGAGASEKLTVDEPGSYNIVCQIHSQMQATLVVN